jgi:hypothetical protein
MAVLYMWQRFRRHDLERLGRRTALEERQRRGSPGAVDARGGIQPAGVSVRKDLVAQLGQAQNALLRIFGRRLADSHVVTRKVIIT